MLVGQVPYTALSQTVVLRVADGRDPAAVLESARVAIERDMPIAAVHRVTTMQRIFDEALGPALQMQSLLVLLGGLALLLGAIGVYGVVTHHVVSRRREWSIRLALGQRPAQLVARIVRRGSALVLAGAALGVAATLAGSRVLASFLYETAPADGLALGGAVLTLVAAGVAAALIPAWRAARTDPASALRES
jgi:ABC-type antimicrobial peptide transport system permease subunit